MKQGRKQFLHQLGSGLIIAAAPGMALAATNKTALTDASDFSDEGAADDEKFWKRIAKKYYQVSPDYINLENGYYGIQPKPVLQAFQKNIVTANEQAARFARKDFPGIANVEERVGVENYEVGQFARFDAPQLRRLTERTRVVARRRRERGRRRQTGRDQQFQFLVQREPRRQGRAPAPS